ncbi:MAG: phospholipase D-like domain-containing protein [Candidatus ainarchaeum sp.]|nr:phospholipase D-like domain-containing protein [Candidatus ainarchaeum sp.]
MKKNSSVITKALFAFIILIIILAFATYKNTNKEPTSTPDTTAPTKTEDIQVYFCPEDCQDINILFKDINELYCSIYDIEYSWFWSKAKSLYDSNKPVYIITDNEQLTNNIKKLDLSVLEDINYALSLGFLKKDNDSGYMHNKFCTFGNHLLMGSKNFSNTSNYDNFILLENKGLSQIAKDEILEMYSGEFNGGEKTISQNGNIKLYFCPEDNCESKYLEELEKAKERIHCEFFSMTLNSLSQAMLSKAKSGVNLKALFEKSQISQYSQLTTLIDYAKKNSKGYIHNKFCIIDDTVITGSMNPSKNSNTKNDESIIIIQDPKIAEIYENKFQEHWVGLTE